MGKRVLSSWSTQLADNLDRRKTELMDAAANATEDGVTIKMYLHNPPGFSDLRAIFRGAPASAVQAWPPKPLPAATIKIWPGHKRG